MGIANIINTSTSSGGGGGEIIRELVNSSDGQGLHFNGASSYISIANSAAAEFGTSDFSLEFILNQTQASTSETYYYTAPYTGDNRMGLWYDKTNTTLKIFFRTSSNTHYDFGYDIAADFGTPTHFVVSADRSGNAVLYRNGSEVGSVNISGSSAVNIGDSNANAFHISANSASTALIGSLYRFRTWNKALTHDEVDTCFQRADVPFESQYGSQTDLVVNGSFAADTNWTKQSGWTISGGVANCETSDDYALYQSASNQTVGKKYRITFTISNFASGGVTVEDDYGTGKTLYAANGTHTEVYTATTTATRFFGKNGATTSLDIDNVTVVAVGAVTDYDLAFANPTQSLMVQNRAATGASPAADGTASAGVSQTQPIVQLNSTSIAAGAGPVTPADNTIHLKAADGAYGIIHENASGVKVATYTGGSSAFIGTQGSHQMSIATAGSERLKITSAGKVGIACTPTVELEVDGEAIVSNGTYGTKLTYSAGNQSGILDTYGNHDLEFRVNNSKKMVIDTAGLATVGSDRPLRFDPTGDFAKLATNINSAGTQQWLSVADDATVTLASSGGTQSALVLAYDSSNGRGGVWFVTYAGTAVLLAGVDCASADTDTKICVYKSAASHTTTFKNRLGSTLNFQIAQIGGLLA